MIQTRQEYDENGTPMHEPKTYMDQYQPDMKGAFVWVPTLILAVPFIALSAVVSGLLGTILLAIGQVIGLAGVLTTAYLAALRPAYYMIRDEIRYSRNH